MKFTPAKRILDEALSTGVLKPGGHVMESSSGTFALALAILCSLYGLRLTLVTGPVSRIVRWRLENLGAELRVVETANLCEGGIQQARLEVLQTMLRDEPEAFWPRQYTNPLNAASYRGIAEDVQARFGRFDAVVGSVGSGGSLFGVCQVLSIANPALKVVAVDHNRSVIFGAYPHRITRMCRETFEQLLAMGAGIPMGNVAFERCDEIHWVPVPKMVQEVHKFHSQTGFLVGPSSGAALAVARRHRQLHSSDRILVLLPDHGVRYVDTMFNPEWLDRWSDDLAADYADPVQVTSPLDVTPSWCYYGWRRRPFEVVMGHPPRPRPAGFNP
jgi:cysteine synthase